MRCDTIVAHRTIRLRGLLSAVLVLLAVAAVTGSGGSGRATPAVRQLQVPRQADVSIRGPLPPMNFPVWAWVEAVGDVNGDGRPDLAISNQQGHAGDATQTFVLYGGKLPAALRLPGGIERGLRVPDAFVKAAGDVNGDGLDDLIRCRRPYAVRQGARAEATVLFGRAGSEGATDLGLHLLGTSCGQAAGDLDGDGYDDLLVTNSADAALPTSVTVVYGSRKPAAVDIGAVGRRGFRVVASRSAAVNAVPVGDVNGDGRADLIVGRSTNRYASARLARLVFGTRRSGTLDVDAARSRSLPAVSCHGKTLSAAVPAGDVNGDHIGDLVAGGSGTSRLAVFLGRRGAWPPQSSCSGSHGLQIMRTGTRLPSFGLVPSAGDLDGDGFGELVVLSSDETYKTPDGYTNGGAVYIVYGRRGTATIDLARDPRTVRISLDRSQGGVGIGFTAAAPGDVSGDGKPDVALGDVTYGQTWLVSGALR